MRFRLLGENQAELAQLVVLRPVHASVNNPKFGFPIDYKIFVETWVNKSEK